MPRANATRINGWLTLGDVVRHLGVRADRIRLHPLPGKATEDDLIGIQIQEKRYYELVDGILVEKIMGAAQSCVAWILVIRMGTFVETHDLGFMMLPDGATRLFQGLVRLPDLSFTSWKRMPTREFPATPISGVVPNLAVEVLSEGNTRREITRKLKEYFLAGVELVWVVDPYKQVVVIFTAPDTSVTLTVKDTLDGGAVLPGFTINVKDLFARLPKNFRKSPRRKKTT